jgi:Cu-Zn family superoxide dismutase
VTAPSSIPLRHRCRTALVAACAGALALGGVALAAAQDATPSARSSISAVGLVNPDGLQIGTVSASESDGAVTFTITASTLTPGDHGMHIHETGSCDPASGFESAGDHFNPEQDVHGPGAAMVTVQVQPSEEELASPAAAVEPTPAASPVTSAPSHAGDLGNLPVGDTGSVTAQVTTASVTLTPDATNSLADADGSALVIHADPDDLATDPDGNSGDRITCAVLFPLAEGGAAASPAASPDAGADTEAGAAITVEGTDALRFAPDTLTVSPGDTITGLNTDTYHGHDFVVDELGIAVVLPNGEEVEITIPEDAAPGEYTFYCSVSHHEGAGMVGTLIVE